MRILLRLVVTWLAYVAIFVLSKPLFMLLNAPVYGWVSLRDCVDVMWHGLRLDMGVAGYLTALPALISIAGIWLRPASRVVCYAYRAYFMAVSLLVSMIFTLNAALYGFWKFPLDMTPLFYFSTSSSAAVASVSWWFIAAWTVGMWFISALIYLIFRRIYILDDGMSLSVHQRVKRTVAVVVFMGFLIIPIRGGFTVATLNPSAAYFSQHQSLNHAAMNPAFSLLYSATHQADFDKMGRYYADDEAAQLFGRLHLRAASDSLPDMLSSLRPDIYVIIMESFSAQLMPSLGGDSIALGVDSIARSGLSFTNFFANGFRTDRGLPAILNALPSPPNTGVMKHPDVIERMPSVAHELSRAGYSTAYYYGGDVNFANMNAFVVGSGFQKVVSDADFPLSQRMSKWGVHDGPLFERVAEDVKPSTETLRHFTVIQTSSSHEPFEVPAGFARFAGQPASVNAFAYADSVITAFVDRLRDSAGWDNTLVIMVADHWGAYPDNLEDARARHHIPLVMTGGALKGVPRQVDVYGSQVDIAPTLMAMLGLDSHVFVFGNNLFDTNVPHFGIYFDSDNAGMFEASPGGGETYTVFNTDTDQAVTSGGSRDLTPYIKAYLQTLYDHMAPKRGQ